MARYHEAKKQKNPPHKKKKLSLHGGKREKGKGTLPQLPTQFLHDRK